MTMMKISVAPTVMTMVSRIDAEGVAPRRIEGGLHPAAACDRQGPQKPARTPRNESSHLGGASGSLVVHPP